MFWIWLVAVAFVAGVTGAMYQLLGPIGAMAWAFAGGHFILSRIPSGRDLSSSDDPPPAQP